MFAMPPGLEPMPRAQFSVPIFGAPASPVNTRSMKTVPVRNTSCSGSPVARTPASGSMQSHTALLGLTVVPSLFANVGRCGATMIDTMHFRPGSCKKLLTFARSLPLCMTT